MAHFEIIGKLREFVNLLYQNEFMFTAWSEIKYLATKELLSLITTKLSPAGKSVANLHLRCITKQSNDRSGIVFIKN